MENRDNALIKVRVLPRSSKDQIVSKECGIYKIKIMAPPIEGKGNKALQSLLAKKLGVAKNRIEVVAGKKSKTKMIRIQGMSLEDAIRRLE